jgi:carbamoyl-phosphate synthase large subunit
MNILISSAGRRVTLVKIFKNILNTIEGKLFVIDNDPNAPTKAFCDEFFIVPKIVDKSFDKIVLDLIQDKKIDIIIPTIDTELMKFVDLSRKIRGKSGRFIISSRELIKIAKDKWLTYQFFLKEKITTPKSWNENNFSLEEIPEKLFIKPRDGSASQHAYACSKDQLENFLKIVPNPIIQERLIGKELTIDAFFDFEHNPIHYVIRERIKTIGGESVIGKTIDDSDIREWLIDILYKLGKVGASGPITLQAFQTENGLYMTEINPRFGGGFPLAYRAGATYPEFIIELISGKILKPDFGNYRKNLIMTRYYQEIFYEKNDEHI